MRLELNLRRTGALEQYVSSKTDHLCPGSDDQFFNIVINR
jgi:hypothetical protein